MVKVFREVWRVLRDDGTLWLNIGDSYFGSWGNYGDAGGGQREKQTERLDRKAYADKTEWRPPTSYPCPGLKPKDLCGIPWRLAFALQADGWYLRSDIIWAKPNPMPESVTDRPTKAHEYIFLLTKSPHYFFDQKAVRERGVCERLPGPNMTDTRETHGTGGGNSGLRNLRRQLIAQSGKWSNEDPQSSGHRMVKNVKEARANGTEHDQPFGSSRNIRTVWNIATQPFSGSHFAVFPEELVRRCLFAGTSEKGCCPKCGGPWVRVVERIDQGWNGEKYGESAVSATGGAISGGTKKSTLGSSRGVLTGKNQTLGWWPSCECMQNPEISYNFRYAPDTIPCIVFDPFFGSGTVGVVAQKYNRRFIGLELKPEYCQMAQNRVNSQPVAML